MKIDTTQVTKILISDLMAEPHKLDPVTVILEDHAPGKGRVIIECYGKSWSSYWGAMSGLTVAAFFLHCSADYLIGSLAGSLRAKRFSPAALKVMAKKSIIDRRRCSPGYWEYGDMLDKEDAAQLWREVDEEIDLIDSDTACWQHTGLLCKLFGEEWWHRASEALEPNPDYLYLERIVGAVQQALRQFEAPAEAA
jgi:hypothetical protein